ncbi:hypothetical protein NLU13_5188 [Sarocladium strictum]|uniref:Rhodopsin domain-containing protein n=1 Tax=Sarocladium strictum TaxID=5046 RepID=A0AA39GGE9_SARSR|nr:hypothetical protein NLU13_5188 [Sarocladium strictum]
MAKEYTYSKEQMIGLAISFMVLPIFFYGLRVWARTMINRVTLDDYLAGGALIFTIACCSLQLAAAFHGHLGEHQPQYPNGTAIMDDPGLAFFEKSKFAMNMLSLIGLGLVKSSILVLYLSIFPNRIFKWCVIGMLCYVGAWTISFFFSHLFICIPVTAFIDFFETRKCLDQVALFLTVLYTNIVADFVILLLPIPMVIKTQMKRATKCAVLGMLMLGASVCAVSVTRVVAIYAVAEEYTKHPNDIIYYTAPVFFWTNIEMSMAVVCACLPTLRPLWISLFPKEATTINNSYELGYGSAARSNRVTNQRSTPYTEIDELELRDGSRTRTGSPDGRDILKKTTISQTVEPSDSSSTKELRPTDSEFWRDG